MNDVRLVALRAYHARVRLRRPIRHAGHARDANDTLLVRAELSDGSVGWGEGLPRDYVTGETIESTLDAWKHFDATPLFDAHDTDLFEATGQLPFRINGRRVHALRAAVEIALLDAFGKAVGRPVGDLLADGKPRPESVRYGVVLPLTKRWKTDALARVTRLAGVRDVKLKVGLDHAADVAACRR
ncbi:MAG: dipeptide epimerase, partial [Planctomycetota bacterium]